MGRKEELLSVFKDADRNAKTTLLPLIDEIVFMEQRLDSLKKLPFLKVHPENPGLQKSTPAAKQYKELLQQYTNCIKILSRMTGADESDEESPLRRWVKKYVDPI